MKTRYLITYKLGVRGPGKDKVKERPQNYENMAQSAHQLMEARRWGDI
jgi:hypothetical protein